MAIDRPAPTLDEISAALAVVIAPLAAKVDALDTKLSALAVRVDENDRSINSRLDGFIAATNANFTLVIGRLDGIDKRLDRMDRFAQLEQRVAALEAR